MIDRLVGPVRGESPWPWVEVAGELDRAGREWLHTNGTGAYSMSTVALMHTRRQHGLLIAALDPPIDRHVVLGQIEESMETRRRAYRLSTHQFPNIAPTPGYRHLTRYDQDPLPRWTFELPEGRLTRTLCLAPGSNTLVLRYCWYGERRARLLIKPLMPFRPTHQLMQEHGAMVQRVTLRSELVEIQPMASVPPVTFRHDGVFVGSPDWWRRFEYLEDKLLGFDYEEDLWTPGTFELILDPEVPRYLTASVGACAAGAGEALMEGAKERLERIDPGPGHPIQVRQLQIAVSQFVVADTARPAVIAGYPWLDVRFRDMLAALPGLFLVGGRVEDARAVLTTALAHQHSGLLPMRLPRSPGQRPASLQQFRGGPQLQPDTTLWLFVAASAYVDAVGLDDPFLRKRLLPGLVRAYVRLSRGWSGGVWINEAGLLVTSSPDGALTWMDARVYGQPVTPRRGVAVEHQALWVRACTVLARLAHHCGHERLARDAREHLARATRGFRDRFWCSETDYPFDCLSPSSGADGWADPGIRPNALIAADVAPELFDEAQLRALTERARDHLLTDRGVRSLSPGDGRYVGYYEGRLEERESAYHQGTGWAHLLGAMVRVGERAFHGDPAAQDHLRARCLSALEGNPVLGHVAQLSDGDAPHQPRGTPAGAWAAAELLRVLADRREAAPVSEDGPMSSGAWHTREVPSSRPPGGDRGPG